jgi:hypothetical protein
MSIKVFRRTYPEHVDLISYNYTTEHNGIEIYKIVYKKIYAELMIYNDDILHGLRMDSIEFNVNGNFVQISNETELNLDNMFDIYTFMAEHIDLQYFVL